MNKSKLVKMGGVFIVLLALAALIGSSLTFAQNEPEPEDPVTVPEDDGTIDEDSSGNGRFGHHGSRGGLKHLIDREAARELLAEELGVTVEDLDAAHTAAHEAIQADEDGRPDRDEMKAFYAAELGLTVEELNAAQTAVQEAMLTQLVEDGVITQEQLNEIMELQALRELAKDIFSREDAHAVIAETLGMTVEEYEVAREDGSRLSEIAETQGIDLETVMTAVTEARTAAFDQAVADGLLTQEQADELLSQNDRLGFGGHGRGDHGEPHGGGFGNGSGNFAPDAPADQSA